MGIQTIVVVISLLIPSILVCNGVENFDLIRPYLPPNPKIIEAGSHNGKDTVRLSEAWPQGHVYAFEPVPEIYSQLKERTKVYANISTFELAFSDVTGKAIMHISSKEGTGSSSLLDPKEHLQVFNWISFPSRIEVRTTTIDQWISDNEISSIDFLWLDLQGHEYNVLKASPAILATVKVIVTEVNFRELYSSAILYPEYKKWLVSQGFCLIHLDKVHATWGDAVFVRKK